MQAELSGERLSALQARAVAAGVAPAQLAEAVDDDAPKQAVIALLLTLSGALPMRSYHENMSSHREMLAWVCLSAWSLAP